VSTSRPSSIPSTRGEPSNPAASRWRRYSCTASLLDKAVLARLRRRLGELVHQTVAAWDANPDQKIAEPGVVRVKLDAGDRDFAPCHEHQLLADAATAVLGPDWHVSGLLLRAPLPGCGHQGLHPDFEQRRTQGPWQTLSAMWCISAFTPDNGPLRVIPGSHQRIEPPIDMLAFGSCSTVPTCGTPAPSTTPPARAWRSPRALLPGAFPADPAAKRISRRRGQPRRADAARPRDQASRTRAPSSTCSMSHSPWAKYSGQPWEVHSGGACSLVVPHPIPGHQEKPGIGDKIEQIVEPAMRIITSPTVQLGLDLQYPDLGPHQSRSQFAGIHREIS
jgi:hypothetical protein